MVELEQLVADIATAIQRADHRRPRAVGSRTGREYQAGIGPHTEAATLGLIVDELVGLRASYELYALDVAYPGSARQRCDWCLGSQPDWDWALEAKLLRMLGDNGKLNDNMLMHILSPYAAHRSALTDCAKLAASVLGQRKAVLIIGYDYDDWGLEPAIDAFETLARRQATLGTRHIAMFNDLIHPVHRRGSVFAWEVSTLEASLPSGPA